MKNPVPNPHLGAAGRAALLAAILAAPVPFPILAQTYVHVYRLGESDPGAVAGGTVSATVDSGTTPVNLTAYSGPVYSSTTPGAGSPLAIAFNGSQCLQGSIASLEDNFGIEVWFQPSVVDHSDYKIVFQLGYGSAGICLGIQSSNLSAYVPGHSPSVNIMTTAVANAWTHVALVRASGQVKGYVNGTQMLSDIVEYSTHTTFTIAGSDQRIQGFIGEIDNLRIFTFETGAFNTSMFAYPASAIPEPSTYAGLMGLAALGLVALRRRRMHA